jgi:hypothetical protein
MHPDTTREVEAQENTDDGEQETYAPAMTKDIHGNDLCSIPPPLGGQVRGPGKTGATTVLWPGLTRAYNCRVILTCPRTPHTLSYDDIRTVNLFGGR